MALLGALLFFLSPLFDYSFLKGKERDLYIREIKFTRWRDVEDSILADGVSFSMQQAVELFVP